MPSNARKKPITSSTTSRPTTREIVRRNALVATAVTRSAERVGTISMPEDPVVEEACEPARRVEEVERVTRRRRVDDDEVEVAGVVQLVELLHRHVLLRARQRAGDVPVEAVVEDALRLLLGGRVLRDEVVERRLGVEHQRVQLAGLRSRCRRCPTASGRSRSACSRGARCRACRRAAWPGSMVTTTARRPRRAPSTASAADVVVFPTPPVPQQTMTWRSVTSAHRLRSRRSRRVREIDEPDARRRTRRRASSTSVGPMSAVKRNGSRICGSGSRSASRAHCSC